MEDRKTNHESKEVGGILSLALLHILFIYYVYICVLPSKLAQSSTMQYSLKNKSLVTDHINNYSRVPLRFPYG